MSSLELLWGILVGARDPAELSGLRGLRARQGQTIFDEGDPSDAVYLLLEGRVRTLVSQGQGGATHTTGLLSAPALFGDRDLLLGREATETAVCLASSRLLAWESASFLGFWQADPEAQRWQTKDLAARYARSLELTALQLSSLGAFIAALWADAETNGQPRPQAAELAAITGAAHKSVLRAISGLDPAAALEPRPLFHRARRE